MQTPLYQSTEQGPSNILVHWNKTDATTWAHFFALVSGLASSLCTLICPFWPASFSLDLPKLFSV